MMEKHQIKHYMEKNCIVSAKYGGGQQGFLEQR